VERRLSLDDFEARVGSQFSDESEISSSCRKEQTGELPMNARCSHGMTEIVSATVVVIISAVLFSGCGTKLPPLKTVCMFDIPRFMGDWYVIANIPTWIEKDAYNAVESYRLDADGTIATTFTFRKGAFDGPLKTYKPRGFIVDTSSNAVWGMRFIWPIKAEYLITYLNENYSQTVIGRNKRDYVWIMARTPAIPEEDYARLVAELAAQGYDTSLLQKVPQRWPK
jgi:apolipoprotein D and lipocalin family protein